jgi:hypothetical protein
MRTSEVISLVSVSCCKDSANRTKNQIFLDFSEVQPIFSKGERYKLVRKAPKEKGIFCCIDDIKAKKESYNKIKERDENKHEAVGG